MSIPDYQTIMLPLLKYFGDKQVHATVEAIEHISDLYKLSEEERNELLPSGRQPYIDNRVGWARTYLKKAGLLEYPSRGHIKITEKGLAVLEKNPNRIDIKYLVQFPNFVEFRSTRKEQGQQDEILDEQTPDELMVKGHDIINANLSQELLIKIMEGHYSFLENLVLKLLTNMGYGKGKVTGRSGDEGVDGFIDQDKLGLDKIYFQAKRYDEKHPVTVSHLRDFIGALELKGVNKGIFITTSKFPNKAEQTIAKTSKSIILIDGTELAKLMIDFNIGVTTEQTYDVKKIDTDFFEVD